jgi:hypothetical protein
VDEPKHPTDDASLLAASAAGGRDASAMFYRRHLAGVLSVLVGETRDPELAADLAAEVFAAALLGAGRYRPDYPTAMPWLSATARHKARDSLDADARVLRLPAEVRYEPPLRNVPLRRRHGLSVNFSSRRRSSRHSSVCSSVTCSMSLLALGPSSRRPLSRPFLVGR